MRQQGIHPDGARWLLCFADAVMNGGFNITY
jgi:hypothetical protein